MDKGIVIFGEVLGWWVGGSRLCMVVVVGGELVLRFKEVECERWKGGWGGVVGVFLKWGVSGGNVVFVEVGVMVWEFLDLVGEGVDFWVLGRVLGWGGLDEGNRGKRGGKGG